MKKGDVIKLNETFLGIVIETKTYFDGEVWLTYKAITPKAFKGDVLTIQINIRKDVEILGNVYESKLIKALYS